MADLVYPGEPSGGPINAGAMPTNYDLRIYQGDTLRFTVTIKDPNGVPVNLTGYSVDAHLKENFLDNAPIEFTCAVTTPTSGVVSVLLPAIITSGLDANKSYIWDFQVTDTGGDVRTYLAGDVKVLPEVTSA